jgi:predicted HNH restriction endonuclease
MADKRTYSDRAEYLKMAVSRRRKQLKQKAVDYKGGQCEVCGYNRCSDALEFHHLDPNEKDFGLSQKGITRAWEKVQQELDKCAMVCSNCHKEIHADLTQPPSVTKK